MYIYVGMILTPSESSEKTLDNAEAVLSKFDLNIKVPEYKSYLDREEVDRMRKHYGTSDTANLVEKLKDWTGEPGGSDERGVYVTTTRNPEGHIDSWQLFGPAPVESRMFVHPDAYCSAIILDDGVWQASPNVYNMPREDGDRIMDKWEADLEETIKASSSKVAIIARCHM